MVSDQSQPGPARPSAGRFAGPAPSPREATDLILRLARSQQGVVGRQQLLEAGLHPRQVDIRVNRRVLVVIGRGVYAVGHDVLGHRARWRAALLGTGPGASLSHWSAAAVWGVAKPRDRIEVVRRHSRANRPRGSQSSDRGRRWIVVHRSRNLEASDFTIRDGFPVTTFVRTMIDLSARLDEDRIRSMLREAEWLRIADWRELRRATESGRGRAGIARLRKVAAEWTEADSETRSDLELWFLSLCRRADVPLPIVNGSVSGYEVDCTWPDHRFAVELDGYGTHRGRSAFESDRLRDMVVTRAGFQVVRISDRMLKNRPDEVAALLVDRLAVRT